MSILAAAGTALLVLAGLCCMGYAMLTPAPHGNHRYSSAGAPPLPRRTPGASLPWEPAPPPGTVPVTPGTLWTARAKSRPCETMADLPVIDDTLSPVRPYVMRGRQDPLTGPQLAGLAHLERIAAAQAAARRTPGAGAQG